MLDEIGLERTAITVIPSLDKNPLGDEGQRQAAVDYLRYCTDCAAALGAPQLAGPVHQTIGHFSGAAPTETERERAREVHRKAGDYAASQNVRLVLEAINRFECYFANTIDDLSAYLDSLAHPAVTGMYDTFHANIEETGPGGGVQPERAQYRLRAHLGERPRRAGARARAVGGDVLGDEALRL